MIKSYGAHLKACAAMVRLRLYEVLRQLPPKSYEGINVIICVCVCVCVWICNDLLLGTILYCHLNNRGPWKDWDVHDPNYHTNQFPIKF